MYLRGTLIVKVNTSDGTPEPNASVTLTPGNNTLLTDDQGTVRFNDLELGTYQVTVELSMDSDFYVEGFIYEFSRITIAENDTETLNVEIVDSDQPTGTLIVKVNTSDGTPEPNASVTLTPGNGTLLTDDRGTVRFNNLEIGTYQVTVELSMDSDSYVEGFIYEFNQITIAENDTETLNVEIVDPVQPYPRNRPGY